MSHSSYEQLETEGKLPFDVSLHSVNFVPNHWHMSVELIFVLSGNLEVSTGNRQYRLKEGDMLLINQCYVHEVIGLDQNIIATFQIPTTYLKQHIHNVEKISFECYSAEVDPEKQNGLDNMRQLMAEMVQLKYKGGEAYELEMEARMLGLFSILVKQFKLPNSGEAMNIKYMERMMSIITYIDEHYKDPVSLQTIAEREYLSVPYLSKFFSENIGVNFQTYLTSIRLKNTVEALLRDQEHSLAELALEQGFPNAKSFYAAFKSRYHITPHEYRKKYRPQTHAKQEGSASGYLAFNQASALGIIRQFLRRSQSHQLEPVHAVVQLSASISLDRIQRQIQHSWKNIITISKANEGLQSDVQAHLKYVQERCPFRYLRFHGIFDDSMMVYREDHEGQVHYNFRFVDQLFDFLLSIGLKPFIELGFMPFDLAADSSKHVFYEQSYVSPPKSMDRWCELVDRFIRHCLNRYGLEEVESWRFEFWNEPEYGLFWPATEEAYNEMYARTFDTLKAISLNLQIGAPGRIITLNSNAFCEQFFAFCKERGCLPDFIPLHFYPHEDMDDLLIKNGEHKEVLSEKEISPLTVEGFNKVSPNPDYLKESLEREIGLLAEVGLNGQELYLTEWNSTAFHRELTNDTLYKAAYIVKNIIENLDRISGFGYWVLSDNIEETAASSRIFHGGLGLMAQYGIPKAAMHAYEMLAKLGNQLVAHEEGYIVTAGRGGYQILAYNYCHFDDLYALGDTSFITPTSRYSGFKNERLLKIELTLTGLSSGRYKQVTHTISRAHGSSFDKWVEMGAPTVLTAEDTAYLKAASLPGRQIQLLEVGEELSVVIRMEPHSVELIELTPLF
ncbi:helix-turn-helix domain-containing protein [Paenibacillus sp. G2S3]|uniref:GH39 family glycosyl hydrolase n=1 Tax=Paenibacillus sp. G2S3 TaxID=3047872 RepID=UPI0024C1D205|nr:helix-turn-helix domain-containing protein [Paenibacillus sp. G2S3]WHY22112.1 helix-turn-helix domain-containing protein [Paenibacillus sp. G2S3]